MKNENGIVEEECGCVYNWNDHFYESRCDDCAENEKLDTRAFHEQMSAQADYYEGEIY